MKMKKDAESVQHGQVKHPWWRPSDSERGSPPALLIFYLLEQNE